MLQVIWWPFCILMKLFNFFLYWILITFNPNWNILYVIITYSNIRLRCSSSLTARVLSPDNPHKVSQHSHQVSAALSLVNENSDSMMFTGDRPCHSRRIADARRSRVSETERRPPPPPPPPPPLIRSNHVINQAWLMSSVQTSGQ